MRRLLRESGGFRITGWTLRPASVSLGAEAVLPATPNQVHAAQAELALRYRRHQSRLAAARPAACNKIPLEICFKMMYSLYFP